MTRLGQAWKAIVAFLAPGLALAIEPLVTSSDFTSETLTRAVIVAGLTSLLVYLKTNSSSQDPTTSTPGPGLLPDAGRTLLGTPDAGRTLLGTLGVILLVIAAVLTVTTLLGLTVIGWFALVATALIGLTLLLLDGSTVV